ncbi:MAG: SPOR domain-containing protein [Burkholderiaceae bacterium]|jgi:cell division protein FtsN|nr:SPOR domain-containing protein [Burkholderiaceae bacterium]
MIRFKQRGGTFLGIILGVIVGLAVAMMVAVYVAKVPVPFVNKSASRTSGQDAAEAEKNKDWDPNAPLRSRTTVPATAPSDELAAREAASMPDPVPIAAPAEVSPPPPPPPSSGDPLGEFVATRMGAQPQAPADPFAYFVQAGAFRASEDAQAQRARLSLMDVQAHIAEGDQSGHPVYRVRIGPLQNKDAADRVKERLASNGFEAVLVRVQR